MKSGIYSFVLTACMAAGTVLSSHAQIQLPAPSPSAVISQGIGLGEVRIEFSRPALKGRKMFGAQVPYNSVWRTGANKVTNLILSEEMNIAGKPVPAGKYALLTIPGQTEWTIILNKDADAWGAYTYNEASDVVRFKVKPVRLAKPEEYFTIAFENFTPVKSDVVIRWENTQVGFEIKQDPDQRIMQQIKEKTAASDAGFQTYFAAANYYLETNRDLNQAYEWATKALAMEQAFWVYNLHGKIAAKLGKCDVAREDAEKGLPLAKKANDMSYVINLEKLQKNCGK